jgi:hypothetical protein
MTKKDTRTPSYPLRLDQELNQWVKEQAKTNDRSMNAELVRIVRQAKEATEQKQTAA